MWDFVVLLQGNCRIRDKWVRVTTAWRVFKLRMEERPMEGSCEYIE